jgi:hypothetical protein
LKYLPAFAKSDCGKSRKTSVKIVDLRAEILTMDLKNKKQES